MYIVLWRGRTGGGGTAQHLRGEAAAAAAAREGRGAGRKRGSGG